MARAARTRTARWEALTATLVVAFAALLAFSALGFESLWFDEAWSVVLSQRPVTRTLVEYAASNVEGPPLYFVLLHAWITIWGTSEVAVRGLSALFHPLAVLGVYVLLRKRQGFPIAVVGASLAGSSAVLVHFAQEARAYSLLVALFSFSILAFSRFLARPSAGTALLLGALNLAALCTHQLAAELWLVQLLHLLVGGSSRSTALKVWLLSQLPAIPAVWPYFRFLTRIEEAASWVPALDPAGLMNGVMTTLGHAFLEVPFATRNLLTALPWSAFVTSAVLLVLAAAGAYRCFSSSARSHEASGVLIPSVLGASFLVPLGMHYLIQPTFLPRYLVMGVPFSCALAAIGLFHLIRSRTAAASVALVMIGMNVSGSVVLLRQKNKDDWRAAVGALQERLETGDTIIVSDGRGSAPFDYYYGGSIERVLVPGRYGRWEAPSEVYEFLSPIVRRDRSLWLVMPWGGAVDDDWVGLWRFFHARPRGFVLENVIRVPGSWGGVRIHRYRVRMSQQGAPAAPGGRPARGAPIREGVRRREGPTLAAARIVPPGISWASAIRPAQRGSKSRKYW